MSRHDLRSPTPALLQDSVVAGAVVEDAQPGRGATLVPRRSLLLGLAAFAAGCGGGGSDAPVVPAVAPTLEISSNVPDVAEGRVTVRFEFSSEPAAFASGALPFTMSGGKTVAGSFSKVSATLSRARPVTPRPMHSPSALTPACPTPSRAWTWR
jgi:hypothetical protein